MYIINYQLLLIETIDKQHITNNLTIVYLIYNTNTLPLLNTTTGYTKLTYHILRHTHTHRGKWKCAAKSFHIINAKICMWYSQCSFPFTFPFRHLFPAFAYFSPSIYLLNILISFSYAKVHKYFPFCFFFCFSFLSLLLMSKKLQQKFFPSHIWQLMLLLLERRANCDSICDFDSDSDSDSDFFLRIQRRAWPSWAYSLGLSTCQIKIKFQMNK